MPLVRRNRPSRVLGAVQSQSEVLLLGEPKVSIQCVPDLLRPLFRAAGGLRVTLPPGKPSIGPVSGERISLNLDHRDGRGDSEMILEAVLPPLVEEPSR